MSYTSSTSNNKPFYLLTPPTKLNSSKLNRTNTYASYDMKSYNNGKQLEYLKQKLNKNVNINRTRSSLVKPEYKRIYQQQEDKNGSTRGSFNSIAEQSTDCIQVDDVTVSSHRITITNQDAASKNVDINHNNGNADESSTLIENLDYKIKENELIYKQSKLIQEKFDNLISTRRIQPSSLKRNYSLQSK